MKRMRQFALITLFSLLVLGSTRAFAGPGGNGGNQGGNKGGGLINWIDNLLKDIFDDGNKQGNYQGTNAGSGNGNAGGGTAPIDGGISLLLVAGVGLGMKKLARARQE
jgi:hypothetical protein